MHQNAECLQVLQLSESLRWQVRRRNVGSLVSADIVVDAEQLIDAKAADFKRF